MSSEPENPYEPSNIPAERKPDWPRIVIAARVEQRGIWQIALLTLLVLIALFRLLYAQVL